MNSVYRFMLNNKVFDDIIEKILSGKSVVIVKENEELDELTDYLNKFIINKFDYERINIIINKVAEVNDDKSLEINKMTVLKRKIANNAEDIIKIFSAFVDKDSKSYSLNDLYSITDKSIEFKDKEFEYYSILSKSPVVIENDSSNIIEKAEYLIKNEFVNDFIKYKRFNKNKRFDIIRDDIDIKDIDRVIKKLSGVLNNTFAFIPPIYFNQYTGDFEREKVYYENYTDVQIKDIAKNVNYKHNKDILDELDNMKWYRFFGIKRYKEMVNKKKEIYQKYKNEENLIYNQYIENIENLQMFSNSFIFVKKVFKDEVLKEINNCIVNEEDLYNYIYYIKDTLSIYKDYNSLKQKIEILDSISKEILNYNYEKLNDKNDLNSILEFIPNYYFYREIEHIENNKIDIINSYNKVYEKIIKLDDALKAYEKILPNALRGNCNKETRKFLREKNININQLDINKLNSDRYSKENLSILLKMFPIVILEQKEYEVYKDKLDENFDLVIKQFELMESEYRNSRSDNKVSNERLDRSILKMLNNVGYNIFTKENDISIIYVNFDKEKNKVMYVNNKEVFDYTDLIQIIDLMNSNTKIIFVWYRNWWLNKNDEVMKIQKLLNE